MLKQIKFNLIIDKKPIRDMEDLSDNFNINDILGAYKNGSLKRWLSVRNETDKITELEKIKGDTVETALALTRIFLEKECNKEQLASAAYVFDFREKEMEKLKQFESAKNKKDEIIRAYHGGYEKLLDEMEANSLDYPFLKASVNEIFEKYKWLYLLDMVRVYERFISSCPLVILTFLANRSPEKEPVLKKSLDDVFTDIKLETLLENSNEALNRYLDNWRKGIVKPEIKRCDSVSQLRELRESVQEIILIKDGTAAATIVATGNLSSQTSVPFQYIIYDNIKSEFQSDKSPPVKVFSGETNDYWKDLEQKGKWMIIKIERGSFVRNLGKNGEELGVKDVNSKFPILEGIDYKSKSANDQLIYMEV